MGAPPRRVGPGPETSEATNTTGPPRTGRRAPAPSVHADGAKPGDVIQGRWRYGLVERLGRGGFGSVFLARTLDADPGDPAAPPEQVAVKVLGRTLKRAAPDAPSLARRDAGIALWSTVHGLSSLVLTNRVRLKDPHVKRYVDTVLRPVAEGIVEGLQRTRPTP